MARVAGSRRAGEGAPFLRPNLTLYQPLYDWARRCASRRTARGRATTPFAGEAGALPEVWSVGTATS